VARCARSACGRRRPDLLAAYLRFGLFLDQEWYCSTRCVEEIVRRRLSNLPAVQPAWVQGWRPIKLGLLLMEQVGLSRDAIDAALEAQEHSRIPFGQTLRRLGLVTADDLMRALATQAGVRYLKSVDHRLLALRPGKLARDTVETLRIVPVTADLKRGELQVACTAPIPGHAVRALSRLTQMSVEPLLVADDQLPGLINVYNSAATIARLAKAQRSVVMTQERCDPYVWVRLASGSATADVLMTLSGPGRI
jgi:hypothetical protein